MVRVLTVCGAVISGYKIISEGLEGMPCVYFCHWEEEAKW
jgi:hypothetical protein